MKVNLKGLRHKEIDEVMTMAVVCGLHTKGEKGYTLENFERFWGNYEQLKKRKERRIIIVSVMFGCIFTRLVDFLLTLL